MAVALPQPPQPSASEIQSPMVYVYEQQRWEYRVITSAISQDELNMLGADGWELLSVVALPAKTQFYFTRIRA
jgi:hypothetical protein